MATITGTTGNDTLTGTSGDDTIYGLAGNDYIDGGDGNDSMYGGTGDDTYVVDTSDLNNDTVYENSGEGTDTVISGLDTYTLTANVENLTLKTGDRSLWGTGNGLDNVMTGNDGDNYLIGAGGNDTLYGGAGDDALDGEDGADTMVGGTGDDLYVVDNASDVVTENSGEGTEDRVDSFITYTLGANVENLSLIGSGNLNGTGNTLDNGIVGNLDNNILDGGTGADSMAGESGNDTYVVDNAGDVVTEYSGEGTDTVQSSISYTLGTYVENLTLTGTGNIDGTGNSGANTITGNSGNNTLDGGAGADAMSGGAGNDIFIVDDAGDTVAENSSEGTDLVQSSVTFTLGSNVENLTLTGSSSINGTGNILDNIITGNSGANTLSGGGGNDTLDGGTGADSMAGGTGNDIFVVDNAGDTVSENSSEGTDLVQSSITYTLGSNVENLTLTGSSAINGTGNSLDNVITGNSAVNTLTGGAGNDTYVISNASAIIVENSSEGTDTVLAGVSSFNLDANIENLTFTTSANSGGYGNALDNIILGNSGNDGLHGEAGNDYIDGGTGYDQMYGGTGNDTFVVDDSNDNVYENSGEGTDLTYTSLASYALTANVENLTLTYASGAHGDGNTLDNIIIGNSGVDTIRGLAGNDVLDGGAGADYLEGGTGNDTFVVDNTSEHLTENASEGTDLVQSSVTWTLATNFENLTLTGSSNIDGTGNSVANTITGNSGNNTIDGGTGADAMAGGAGNDTFIVDNASDTVTENSSEGTDTVQSSVSFALGSNVENLTLTGSSSITGDGNSLDNTIIGNSGNNSFQGYAGNDYIDGGTGNDQMTGGTGNDTYVVDNSNDNVYENASEGTDTVYTSLSSYGLAANVENLVMTGTGNNQCNGNGLDNVLTGNSGNNTFSNSVGGEDTMIGGLGNDYYYVDSAGDTVIENASEGWDRVSSSVTYTLGSNIEDLYLTGSGNINGTGNGSDNELDGNSGVNTLDGGAGNDTFYGGAGDTLIGGTGNDIFYIGSSSTTTITENSGEGTDEVQVTASYTLGTGSNLENLTLFSGATNGTGNELDNVIIGNSSANTLTGNDGNDTLNGGTGADTLVGGLGNDLYIVDNTGDVVTESSGQGTDSVQSSVTFTLASNVENLTLTGSSAINGTGNGLDNTLTGNSGVNSLTGGAGNDYLDGGAGVDNLTGGTGNDTYVVDSNSDGTYENYNEGTDLVLASVTVSLQGHIENLTLTGSSAINGTGNTLDNVITGNSGANTLSGNDGNDTLSGGDGLDTLTGGSGADTFIFLAASAYHNIDVVSDFSTGQADVLDLRDVLSSYNGSDAITDWVRISNSGSDSTVEVDRDGTGGTYGWTQIATLTGVTGLTDEAALVASGNLLAH